MIRTGLKVKGAKALGQALSSSEALTSLALSVVNPLNLYSLYSSSALSALSALSSPQPSTP